tara:strand:+ start:8830 stop:8982 length:153 start_codon:yes stop_codon:yes gene_type:complete
MIGLNPQDFWSMSPVEIHMATNGFKEFHGGNRSDPLNKTDLDNLMELHPD